MLSSVRYSFYQKQKRQLLVKVYISLLFWEHSFLFLLSSDSTAFPGASICGGSHLWPLSHCWASSGVWYTPQPSLHCLFWTDLSLSLLHKSHSCKLHTIMLNHPLYFVFHRPWSHNPTQTMQSSALGPLTLSCPNYW